MFIQRLEDLQERADACLVDVLLGQYVDLRAASAASLALGKRAIEDGYIMTLERPVPLEVGGSWGLDLSLKCDCSHHPFGVTHRFTREKGVLYMRGVVGRSSATCHVPDASLSSLTGRVADDDREAPVSLWDLVIESLRFDNEAVLKRVAARVLSHALHKRGRVSQLVDTKNEFAVWAEHSCFYLETWSVSTRKESFWMCEKLAQFLGACTSADQLLLL